MALNRSSPSRARAWSSGTTSNPASPGAQTIEAFAVSFEHIPTSSWLAQRGRLDWSHVRTAVAPFAYRMHLLSHSRRRPAGDADLQPSSRIDRAQDLAILAAG